MPLTNSMIEQLASWCVTSDVLAENTVKGEE